METQIPKVNKKDVVFAHDLVLWCYEHMKELATNNIFRNDAEERVQKLYNIIDYFGEEGVSKSKLTRKTRWLGNSMIRENLISDLIKEDSIETFQYASVKNITTHYRSKNAKNRNK